MGKIETLDFAEGAFLDKNTRDLLLVLGQSFEKPSSGSWENISGEKKMCFRNAAEASFLYPELTYVEGYAIPSSGLFPMNHAWLVDSEGGYLDPTWEGGKSYFGIEFSSEELLFCMKESEQYGILDAIWWSKSIQDFLLSKKEAAERASC